MAILTPPPADGSAPHDDDRYTADLPTLPMFNPQPWRMGEYTMHERIGTGAASEVWRATHPLYGEVAVKFVGTASLSAEHHTDKRLTNEFLILVALHHPNIVRTLGRGIHNGMHWISMEYIPGGSLAAMLSQRPHTADGTPFRMNPRWAVRHVEQIARALEYAHQQGILHRDVKPANIFLRERDGHAAGVLGDFGIAYMLGTERLTLDGSAIGTPEYMSPEQCQGHPLDGRTDIYSLGIVLYELLAGHAPFLNDLPLGVCYMHLNNPVPALPSEVDPALAAAVMKALSKRREDRYPTALAFADALAPFARRR